MNKPTLQKQTKRSLEDLYRAEKYTSEFRHHTLQHIFFILHYPIPWIEKHHLIYTELKACGYGKEADDRQ